MVDRVIHGELHEPTRRHSHNASVGDDTRKLITCRGVQSFECDREGTIIELQESRQISRGLQSAVGICECTRGGPIQKPNLRADDVPGELAGAARTDLGPIVFVRCRYRCENPAGQGVLSTKAGKTSQIQHEAGLHWPKHGSHAPASDGSCDSSAPYSRVRARTSNGRIQSNPI
jgi:hypothetical protein